jgi:hypothetical protein
LIGHRVDILDCGLDSFVSMLGTVSPPPLPFFSPFARALLFFESTEPMTKIIEY